MPHDKRLAIKLREIKIRDLTEEQKAIGKEWQSLQQKILLLEEELIRIKRCEK